MIRYLRAVILISFIYLTGSCDYLKEAQDERYREYHQSRFKAVALAFANGSLQYSEPDEPEAPAMIQGKVDYAYPDIVRAAKEEGGKWEEVINQTSVTTEFVAEMLDVLVSRDTVSIESLTPQIKDYEQQQNDVVLKWRNSRSRVAYSVDELMSLWDQFWEEHDLEFDLAKTVLEQRQEMVVPPDSLRKAALEHYHQNEYDRLAMIYLGYEPEVSPNPKSHIPEGLDDVSRSLRHLEAALLVRYSMDQAIENDVGRIQSLTRVDMSETPWDKIKIPTGKYARPKVNASLARLKLLKYLDSLLTSALDVLVYDVDRHWEEVWPNNGLETNIFAYCGLSESHELDDPLDGVHTFRQ